MCILTVHVYIVQILTSVMSTTEDVVRFVTTPQAVTSVYVTRDFFSQMTTTLAKVLLRVYNVIHLFLSTAANELAWLDNIKLLYTISPDSTEVNNHVHEDTFSASSSAL